METVRNNETKNRLGETRLLPRERPGELLLVAFAAVDFSRDFQPRLLRLRIKSRDTKFRFVRHLESQLGNIPPHYVVGAAVSLTMSKTGRTFHGNSAGERQVRIKPPVLRDELALLRRDLEFQHLARIAVPHLPR